jgi:hypothetical protein
VVQRVGRLEPNAFGLLDLHGNVWEWCADTYDEDYYARSGPVEPLNLDVAPRQDGVAVPAKVTRGGSICALVILAVGGASLPPLLARVFVLVGRASEDAAMTEAFAWLVSAFIVGTALGSTYAGALVDSYSVGSAFASAALVSSAALLIWAGRPDRTRRQKPTRIRAGSARTGGGGPPRRAGSR